jgi:hypothetical protein
LRQHHVCLLQLRSHIKFIPFHFAAGRTPLISIGKSISKKL